MEQLINTYQTLRKKIKAYHYALWMISWDSMTEAPSGCFETRADQTAILSEEYYKIQTSKEFIETVNALFEQKEHLEAVLQHEIVETKKTMEKTLKIPMEEYVAFQSLMASSEIIWAKAKNSNDFSMFVPTLQKIVDYQRNYVVYQESDALKGYDILLDEYESGFTTKEYDEFFDLLKKELVPFVKEITRKQLQYDDSFASLSFSREDQIKFANYLQDVLCYDMTRGLMKESEHPFTSGFGSSDVRFTVHYYETMFVSSIFSAIHELGHAIYEQQSDPALDVTFSGGGASMAMHESQSRFYENIVGRSLAFWEVHYPKLQETFPQQLGQVSLDMFYKEINKVENSLIRTESDELTYSLHIMLRYDIEKALISGELSVEELPQQWNKLMMEYFGIEVPNDKQGVLQDVHWAGGMIGYFPTYALGSAYSAQIYHAMLKDLDVVSTFQEGTTEKINAWLKQNIHRYGASLYPKEVLKLATGEDFSPHYYVDYLKNKYRQLYQL